MDDDLASFEFEFEAADDAQALIRADDLLAALYGYHLELE